MTRRKCAILSAAVLVLAVSAAPAVRAQAASPSSYLNFSADIIQVKLKNPLKGAVLHSELEPAQGDFKVLTEALAQKGAVAMLARFESSLFEDTPAVLEAMRDVIVVSPASFEDKEYMRFETKEVGTFLTLAAVQAGSKDEYTLTMRSQISSVTGYMRDGNPIILRSSITGTCKISKGTSVIFSAVVSGDDGEAERTPLADFKDRRAGAALVVPSAYQIFVVISVSAM